MAILMALMSSVVWGTSDFIGGLVSRRLPAYLVVVASQAAGLAAVVVVALVAGGFGDGHGWLAPAVVGGVSLAGGLVLFYTALAGGTMGVVSPITALGVLVPVVVGIARGDAPSTVTKIGIALALVGIVAASGPELRRGAGTRSVVLAAGAAVLFGIAMVLLAEGAQDSPVMTLLGMRAASVLGLVAGIPLVGVLRSRARMRGGDLPLIALAGLGDAGANLLFSLASLRGYISVVAVLASLYPVMTTLLARVVLQQRLLPLQLAGVAAALAGVALVSVG